MVLSSLFVVASVFVFLANGLNFGIDFRGGTLIEATKVLLTAELRGRLSALDLGEVHQEFGKETDVLIRIAEKEGATDAGNNLSAVEQVREELSDFDVRRVEIVGPQVSAELIQTGIMAVLAAIASMLIYIWFRFEWQFSVGAVLALVHDVALTIGLFALLQLDFNLSILAAILTIVGYSMNDTVVVYDRVRENLRKYEMDLAELLNIAINETLSLVMTSVTTMLALLALILGGGDGFTFA